MGCSCHQRIDQETPKLETVFLPAKGQRETKNTTGVFGDMFGSGKQNLPWDPDRLMRKNPGHQIHWMP